MKAGVSSQLSRRLRRVKLLLCDVDGVLTDGRILMGDGKEFKAFSIQDGLGLLILQRAGIKVGWVSNRPSPVSQQRAEELKVDYFFQRKGNKVEAIQAILKDAQLDWEDMCYMGDDVVDLGALKRAGVAVAVANAIDEAKQMAHYLTRAPGGHGAVREVVRLILVAQKKWPEIVQNYLA
ncbi:MAG: HAD hydrolase family protein [Verrucomicrobia subdivision 3 bacterium]|nr:HAD hydrolase family protein [Limisphaerales bacterium]